MFDPTLFGDIARCWISLDGDRRAGRAYVRGLAAAQVSVS